MPHGRCPSPTVAAHPAREDFLYVFKPALAGRAQPSCALGPCRSAHGPARPGRAVPTDQQETTEGHPSQGSATREGFLVLAQRHRPHRPHQPRCAPRHRPRPRRPQQMSPRDRRGRGRRRGVPGLTRPARPMKQPGRRGRGAERPGPEGDGNVDGNRSRSRRPPVNADELLTSTLDTRHRDEQGGQDEGAGEVWAEPPRWSLQDHIPRLPTGNGQDQRQTPRRRRTCPHCSAALSGTTQHRPETRS